ncbi:MAG: hypothetical protein ACPIOQ_42590, partial [Promethearchaeia archaeon]
MKSITDRACAARNQWHCWILVGSNYCCCSIKPRSKPCRCVCVCLTVCVCASQRQWPPCGSYLDLVFRNQAETVQGGAPQDVAVLDPSPPTSTSHSTVAAQRVTRSKTVMEARAARGVGGAMGTGHEGPAGAGLLNQADKGKGLGVEPAGAAGVPGEPSTTGLLSGTDAPAQVRSPMTHSTAS